MTLPAPTEAIRSQLRNDPARAPSPDTSSALPFLLILMIVWVGIVAIVNPVGEFMVNDDWSFQRALEEWITHGSIHSTGWGPASAPGGPSLIFHLLWGRLFQLLLGASSTALRVSALAMGISGSVALFFLLRRSSPSTGLALWATLTLVLNPLFLSQCFTFMSDITFAGTAIFSIWFLYLGVRAENRWLIVGGLVFALCSVLTRQLALVIPVAFCLTCLIYPRRLVLPPFSALGLTLAIVVVPWLCYELFLFHSGGTPLTQHQVFQNLWNQSRSREALDYLSYLGTNLLFTVMYVSFLISPVLALRYRELISSGRFMVFLAIVTVAFLITEAALFLSLIQVPVKFLRNIVFDFGVGPILLKDTYILGIRRGMTLPSSVYCVVLYVGLLSVGAMVCLLWAWLRRAFTNGYISENPSRAFLGIICFIGGFIYVGLITLSGFHDRYLIPMCIFGIIWLAAGAPPGTAVLRSLTGAAMGLLPLLAMGLFSVVGLHDFMAMKQSVKSAQDYVVHDLGVAPCDFDGGFEFNGYHCYRQGFEPKPGLSWWWVQREKYLVTLGPLPDYETTKIFPYKSLIGGPSAVHVLKPTRPAAAGE